VDQISIDEVIGVSERSFIKMVFRMRKFHRFSIIKNRLYRARLMLRKERKEGIFIWTKL